MADKLRTVVFTGERQIEIQEYDVPKPDEDQVLVRVECCAICTWEQRVYTGIKKIEYPFIGGHEMIGHIVEIGSKVNDKQWQIGDRVAIGTMLACGDCYQCKTGNEQNCEHFDHSKSLPGLPYHGMGGFSSHIVTSPKYLFKIWNVSSVEAAITEPLSCVIHSVETANIQLGEVVVVIGCGIMGLLHTIIASRKGALVIASDSNEERTALALKLGAKYVINPAKESLLSRVKEISRGTLAQVIFNTTSIPEVAEDAMKCLGINGRLVLYSSFYPDKPISFSPDWIHKNAVKIMGTANSNQVDFVKASRMISMGIVDMKPFVSEVYPVSKAKDAFESAIKGDKFRVVLTF